MKSCFNWTSSRQMRDEGQAPNKLIWSSVIKSSAPVLMNRVPVPSHNPTLRAAPLLSYPYLTFFPVTTLSLLSPLSFESLSLFSLSLIPSLSISLFISIFCCYYPLCLAIPLSLFSLLSLALQFSGSSADDAHSTACGRSPTCFTDSSCGGKQRH